MKKMILLLITCFCFLAPAMSQRSSFDKYADMEGVTSVFISKTMLRLMPKMDMQGMDIGPIAAKLESVRIFTTERPAIAKNMKEDAASYLRSNTYEELMRVRDGDEFVLFYIRPKPDGRIAELAMFVEDKDEFVAIQIVGDLTLEDIQRLTKNMH
jgi:hypothetical protein